MAKKDRAVNLKNSIDENKKILNKQLIDIGKYIFEILIGIIGLAFWAYNSQNGITDSFTITLGIILLVINGIRIHDALVDRKQLKEEIAKAEKSIIKRQKRDVRKGKGQLRECDMCNKQVTQLTSFTIKDDLGMRELNVCPECMEKYKETIIDDIIDD